MWVSSPFLLYLSFSLCPRGPHLLSNGNRRACWTVTWNYRPYTNSGLSLRYVVSLKGLYSTLLHRCLAFLWGKAKNTVFSTHLLPLVSNTIGLAALLVSSTIIPLYLEMLISCNARHAHPASCYQSGLFMSGNLSAPDASQQQHPWAQLQVPCEKCLLLFSPSNMRQQDVSSKNVPNLASQLDLLFDKHSMQGWYGLHLI